MPCTIVDAYILTVASGFVFFAFPVSCLEFLQWFDTVGWASERAPSLQNWVMRCRCVYLSRVRCRLFAYGPADAASILKPHHLLPHLNADWFYRLTQVVLEKRPLNECSSSYIHFWLMTVYLLFGNWMCLYISVQCGCLSFPYDDTIVWSWCSGINLLSVLMSLFDLRMLIVFLLLHWSMLWPLCVLTAPLRLKSAKLPVITLVFLYQWVWQHFSFVAIGCRVYPAGQSLRACARWNEQQQLCQCSVDPGHC